MILSISTRLPFQTSFSTVVATPVLHYSNGLNFRCEADSRETRPLLCCWSGVMWSVTSRPHQITPNNPQGRSITKRSPVSQEKNAEDGGDRTVPDI